jgi:hypothetical protein
MDGILRGAKSANMPVEQTPFPALAANRAQTTVPIVFAVVGDPVQSSLATTLSGHPNGRHGFTCQDNSNAGLLQDGLPVDSVLG